MSTQLARRAVQVRTRRGVVTQQRLVRVDSPGDRSRFAPRPQRVESLPTKHTAQSGVALQRAGAIAGAAAGLYGAAMVRMVTFAFGMTPRVVARGDFRKVALAVGGGAMVGHHAGAWLQSRRKRG